MRTQQSQIDLRYHIVSTLSDLRRIKTAFTGSTALCVETSVLYEYKTFASATDVYAERLPNVVNLMYYYQVSDAENHAGTIHFYYTNVPGNQGDGVTEGTPLYTNKECTNPVTAVATDFKYTNVTDATLYAPGCWIAVGSFSNNVLSIDFDRDTWQYNANLGAYVLDIPISFPIAQAQLTFYDTDTNTVVYVNDVIFTYNNDTISMIRATVSSDPDCRFSGKICIAFDRIVL